MFCFICYRDRFPADDPSKFVNLHVNFKRDSLNCTSEHLTRAQCTQFELESKKTLHQEPATSHDMNTVCCIIAVNVLYIWIGLAWHRSDCACTDEK